MPPTTSAIKREKAPPRWDKEHHDLLIDKVWKLWERIADKMNYGGYTKRSFWNEIFSTLAEDRARLAPAEFMGLREEYQDIQQLCERPGFAWHTDNLVIVAEDGDWEKLEAELGKESKLLRLKAVVHDYYDYFRLREEARSPFMDVEGAMDQPDTVITPRRTRSGAHGSGISMLANTRGLTTVAKSNLAAHFAANPDATGFYRHPLDATGFYRHPLDGPWVNPLQIPSTPFSNDRREPATRKAPNAGAASEPLTIDPGSSKSDSTTVVFAQPVSDSAPTNPQEAQDTIQTSPPHAGMSHPNTAVSGLTREVLTTLTSIHASPGTISRLSSIHDPHAGTAPLRQRAAREVKKSDFLTQKGGIFMVNVAMRDAEFARMYLEYGEWKEDAELHKANLLCEELKKRYKGEIGEVFDASKARVLVDMEDKMNTEESRALRRRVRRSLAGENGGNVA